MEFDISYPLSAGCHACVFASVPPNDSQARSEHAHADVSVAPATKATFRDLLSVLYDL